MALTNPDGNIEIYPGFRGHSVVSVSVTPDGEHARFTTDEPRTLNPIKLPRGPQGVQGIPGDPGDGKNRVDERVGYRVFQHSAGTATEQMVYGDTGVRDLGDGRTVRRTDGNVVELEGSVDGLPVGFRPAFPQPGTVHKVYTTADPWPTELPGTEVTPPVKLEGLEGYQAAVAGGYPGTPEQWLNMVYRVVLPPAGTPGQVVTRTATGAEWAKLPLIGPAPWVNITLSGWRPGKPNGTNAVAQSRINNGTVEFNGHVTYTGPNGVEAGLFTDIRIGVIPPAHAPATMVDLPAIFYGGEGIRPHIGRLRVSPAGVLSIFATTGDGSDYALPLISGGTEVNLTGISFPAR